MLLSSYMGFVMANRIIQFIDVKHVTTAGTGYNTIAPNAWSYKWDNNNLIVAMDPEDREVTFEYDGILPTKIHSWLSNSEAITSTQEYTTKGQISKIVNPNGHYVEYLYNNYGFATIRLYKKHI